MSFTDPVTLGDMSVQSRLLCNLKVTSLGNDNPGYRHSSPGPAILTILLALTACTGSGPVVSERQLVSDIRNGADQQGSLVEVFTLGDPEAAELIRRAVIAESRGAYDEALELTHEALKIEPEDPAYWQLAAEIELQRKEWESARNNARQSYGMGPRIGPLCYRNWMTVQRAAEAMGNQSDAQSAAQAVEDCALRKAPTY